MSHFTVLIIGPNPEAQLAPFDENLDTPEYCKGEVSEENKNRMVEYYTEKGMNPKCLDFDKLYPIKGQDWDGGGLRKNPETGIWEEFSTYNPKSKWDWFQLGGRWSGLLKLKPMNKGEEDKPGYTDQAFKRDIDFEGMRNEAEATCREDYNKIVAIFGGTIPTLEHKWETIIDKENSFFAPMTIDEKREFYHAQAACKEVEKHKKELGGGFNLDKYQKPIEQLVKEARESAGQTFAIVKDGVWYEKGEMGWWACVTNEKSNWSEEFAKLLDEIPDDALLSVYDCHI
jgi:hypothetical protein